MEDEVLGERVNLAARQSGLDLSSLAGREALEAVETALCTLHSTVKCAGGGAPNRAAQLLRQAVHVASIRARGHLEERALRERLLPNHPVLVYDPEWDRVRWVAAGEIKKGYQLAYDSESVKVDAPGCMRVEALYQEGELDGEYELNRKDITNDPHHFHGDGVGSTHFSMRHIYKLPTPRFDPDFLSKGPRKIPHRQFEFRAIREITSQHVERHPVFNFETGHGWYTVSGVVVHNCRCVKVPSFGPQDEMSPEDRQRYIDRVNAERKEFGKQELEEAAS